VQYSILWTVKYLSVKEIFHMKRRAYFITIKVYDMVLHFKETFIIEHHKICSGCCSFFHSMSLQKVSISMIFTISNSIKKEDSLTTWKKNTLTTPSQLP
jgi:hypothetical protein